MEQFKIPVVLFIYKREEKSAQIIRRIADIKPEKIYLIADGPRSQEETVRVEKCRRLVENSITWPCEVIKNYAVQNRGVYQNIGMGAKWVFEQEKEAIFLEDDNLPEITFFRFCEELLERYRGDTRVLWICGTNYLEKYTPLDGSSYVFTKHLLPCGWASWSNKFLNFYEGNLELLYDENTLTRIKNEYRNKEFFKYDSSRWLGEFDRIKKGDKPISWDYQMAFSLRIHGLLGIAPSNNQIVNIGVDLDSAHGGTTFDDIMTRRFCGIKSYPVDFPLIHPKTVLRDNLFEKKTTQIVLPPIKVRMKISVAEIIKKPFHIAREESLTKTIGTRIKNIGRTKV